MAKLKEVLGVYESKSSHWVGDGFHVRNLIPSTGLESEVSPFLLLDYAGPTDFPASNKPAPKPIAPRVAAINAISGTVMLLGSEMSMVPSPYVLQRVCDSPGQPQSA